MRRRERREFLAESGETIFGYQVKGCGSLDLPALSGAAGRAIRTGNLFRITKQKTDNSKSGELKMADLQQLEESIVGLSLLDAAQLVKRLEERLGVSAAAAAPVVVAGAGAGAAAAAPAEEKTEFTVVLKEVGANKINVIKAVREVTS